MEDLGPARRALEALTAGRQEELIIILNVSKSQFVPNGLFAHFGDRSYSFADKPSLMVFVGANSLMRGLATSYQRIYRKRAMNWLFADDLERARQQIQAYLQASAPPEAAREMDVSTSAADR